jgi:hypothetical protein
MNDSTAKAIATASIWIAYAVILAFGVFRAKWSGGEALMLMFISVLVISAAAAIGTAAVWGYLPKKAGSTPAAEEKQVIH